MYSSSLEMQQSVVIDSLIGHKIVFSVFFWALLWLKTTQSPQGDSLHLRVAMCPENVQAKNCSQDWLALPAPQYHTRSVLFCFFAIALYLPYKKIFRDTNNFLRGIADLQYYDSFRYTARWFSYIYIFGLFSIIAYYKTLNIVPYVIQ